MGNDEEHDFYVFLSKNKMNGFFFFWKRISTDCTKRRVAVSTFTINQTLNGMV